MLYGLFYSIDTIVGKNDPVKKFAEGFSRYYEGMKEAQKARNEIVAIPKPQYKPSIK